MLPFDVEEVEVFPSKHFRNVKMRKWDWDVHELQEALRSTYRVDREGREKLRIWTRKGGSKCLHVVYNSEDAIVFVINGTEGK